MSPAQTTGESATVTTTESTATFQLIDVDTLLAQLPAAIVAGQATHVTPLDLLQFVVAKLQDETNQRHNAVRQRVLQILESLAIENAAELVATAFDCQAVADNNPPLPVLALPAACPGPVDGVALLDALRDEFRRYLSLPNYAAEAAALWVVHTFAHDLAFNSPIFAVTSPVKRCGKTTLLTLLHALCAKPIGLSNMTLATLYRLIEQEKPTLLIDEADTFLKSDELRGILNSGFTRVELAAVYRTVNGAPVRFRAWAPKAIACIGRLNSTLQDRAIEIRLQRRHRTETVARLRDTNLQIFITLTSQTTAWVTEHTNALRDARPTFPAGLDGNDRACDKWCPLLAIADVAGGHWSATARTAAVALSYVAGTADDSKTGLLLADLRDMFEGNVRHLATAKILQRLALMEERPWPYIRNGHGLTSLELARMLSPFNVKSRTLRFGNQTAKGYSKADLTPVFERYAA